MTRAPTIAALGIAAFAVILLPSSAAHAQYEWPSPATNCTAGKGDNANIDYNSTAAFNTSTTSVAKVYCPIPYESFILFTNTTMDPIVDLNYIDQSSTADVRCTLHVDLFDGTPQVSQTMLSTGVHDAAVHSFTWTFSRDLIGAGRVYSVSCTIPAASSSTVRSSIRSYRLRGDR